MTYCHIILKFKAPVKLNLVRRRTVCSSDVAFNGSVKTGQPLPDVLVVGAGAAGLTAAYFAATQGAKVCPTSRHVFSCTSAARMY